MVEYGFVKVSDAPYEDTERKVESLLKDEGFGILTRIDVHEKFREKLGIDFPRYVILGACSSPQSDECAAGITARS
jgi:uncharacterized protein (DUF302 family)